MTRLSPTGPHPHLQMRAFVEKRLCTHHSRGPARPDVGPSAWVRGPIPWVRLIHANGRFTLHPEIFAVISAAGVEPPAESNGSRIGFADYADLTTFACPNSSLATHFDERRNGSVMLIRDQLACSSPRRCKAEDLHTWGISNFIQNQNRFYFSKVRCWPGPVLQLVPRRQTSFPLVCP